MKKITIHKTPLDAKVAARNRAHQLAIDTVPKMIATLQPFIGKKVLNAGDIISKALREALPDDNCAGQGASADQWFYTARPTNLYVRFQVQECAAGRPMQFRSGNFSESWHRAEVAAHLGTIENGILTNAENTQSWRTDYNSGAILEARKNYERAQAALSAAESELLGFGTHDN